MERNRERVQQQGSGGKQATTSLPGKSEKGQGRDQAGVEDDNAQQQVRHSRVTTHLCLFCNGSKPWEPSRNTCIPLTDVVYTYSA